MLIYLGTTNTASGNPRRGWLRTSASGNPIGWIDEGYLGHAAISGYDDGESVKITVSPAEYKRLKSIGEQAERREAAKQ
jgi:hypothetical protein